MIDSKIIKDAIYNLCVQANTQLPEDVFEKLSNAYESETNSEAKYALELILENAKLAYEKKMPLCQDTGQVLVFLKAKTFPENITEIVNESVEKAYKENFFRKSVTKNALFNRTNTKTNTPCIIYTEPSDNEELEIELLLKGAGSENVSTIEMLSPTATEDEIIEFVVNTVKKSGAKACPPYFIGIGIGGTMEYAGLLSKKSLLLDENIDEHHEKLAEKIKTAINNLQIGAAGLGGGSTALDVKLLTDFTHIACMPVAVTINCHSSRHAKCILRKDTKEGNLPRPCGEKVRVRGPNLVTSNVFRKTINHTMLTPNFMQVDTSDVTTLKSLKQGQNILLSGEIYTARDVAHQRLVKMIKNGEDLPFNIKNKIIFYAGPCPSCDNCIVGSIGPTTSARMDKYAAILYKKGVLATIGKGERSEQLKETIKQTGGIYFTAFGGIACYLAQKFVKKELIAFEDLGTEAICRFEVKDLPIKVSFI